jgi:hypothetical protein
MTFFPKSLALVSFVLSIAAGCSSSSDSTTPATTPDDGGAATDASTLADASTATDSATTTDAKPSTSPCAFGVSGDRTIPSTDALGCPGYLKQLKGMGEYTINVAASIGKTAMGDMTLGFTMSCAAAPKAGDVWTLGKDGCTGNVSLTEAGATTGTVWSISDQATPTQKSETKITFGNVTKMNGTQNPMDVYYLFEVTLETTLIVQPSGSTTVKVTGHFASSALPLGA